MGRKVIYILIFLISGCATSRDTEMMAILGSEITNTEIVGDNLEVHFTVHVTKNVKLVRIYFESWQNGWKPLDYTSWVEIPKQKRRLASYSVGIKEILRFNKTDGKIRATIIASNFTLEDIFGSSVRKEEVIDLAELRN